MISFSENVFRLTTDNTSYWFKITDFGHLEHLYYGKKILDQDTYGLELKRSAGIGTTVYYDQKDQLYCLDNIPLEWSGIGRGDFRQSPIEAKMPDGSFVCDFIYKSHEITDGTIELKTLPTAYSENDEPCKTLALTLFDESNNIELILYYTVFEDSDIITRKAIIKNNNENPLVLRRIMSMMVDIPNKNYKMITFDGGWIKEAHMHERKLTYGLTVNSSTTGASSNRHNPGFLITSEDIKQDYGHVYGFNIIYSGNHYSSAELSNHDLLRIQIGINPHCFEWDLKKDDVFECPEVIMTYSDSGYNKLSQNFHSFINQNIVRGEWKKKARPVLINSWEAHFFRFNHFNLLKMAKKAKKLGIELFVMDDGWFGKRNDDTKGLGDYSINKKKLPFGLKYFSKRIKQTGLDFGLWFEPEMVNEDSDLFRKNPHFAVSTPNKKHTLGRNQMVLDLCNKDVRDYIVDSVGKILDENQISYVKWDMNRHISDAYSKHIQNQGEFFHRYIIGLYEILTRIFTVRPHILLESCSSGGNRFDLGMLCFSPQIWTSDNTDPVERLKIQSGLSYLYPLSTMGAHVSSSPHPMTLRNTPLSTRFNVASFGCLGYELDLDHLNFVEKKEIKKQISYYKENRDVLQYGKFYRHDMDKDNKYSFQCVSNDKNKSVSGLFQTKCNASEGYDYLPLKGLKNNTKYIVKTKEQSLFINSFGDLIKFISPIKINHKGFLVRTIDKLFCLNNCVESYEQYGDFLMQGINLNNQFMGSYYNLETRVLSDYGSNLYTINNL